MSLTKSRHALSQNVHSGLFLGRLKEKVSRRLKQGLYSQLKSYGLHRDITKPMPERPEARIPISIRPLKEQDLEVLLPQKGVSSPKEQELIAQRRYFYQKIPHGCFVAVDERDGSPCFMQWLLGKNDNNCLAHFKTFPELKDGEALLEQAYAPPSHRGLRIMPAAMAMIAERASDLGARHVLTFVPTKNIRSLKGCWRAGFRPHLLHNRTVIGFGTIIHNKFELLANDDPRRITAF